MEVVKAPDVSAARGAKPELLALTSRVASDLEWCRVSVRYVARNPSMHTAQLSLSLPAVPLGRPRSKAKSVMTIVVPSSPLSAIRLAALASIS
jgi:hypothetical protein